MQVLSAIQTFLVVLSITLSQSRAEYYGKFWKNPEVDNGIGDGDLQSMMRIAGSGFGGSPFFHPYFKREVQPPLSEFGAPMFNRGFGHYGNGYNAMGGPYGSGYNAMGGPYGSGYNAFGGLGRGRWFGDYHRPSSFYGGYGPMPYYKPAFSSPGFHRFAPSPFYNYNKPSSMYRSNFYRPTSFMRPSPLSQSTPTFRAAPIFQQILFYKPVFAASALPYSKLAGLGGFSALASADSPAPAPAPAPGPLSLANDTPTQAYEDPTPVYDPVQSNDVTGPDGEGATAAFVNKKKELRGIQ